MKHKVRKSETTAIVATAHIPLLNTLAECAAECAHCFAACLEEEDVKTLTRCIELTRDCERICQLASFFVASSSEFAHAVLKLCTEICAACASECGKHEMVHCKECEAACLRCVQACNEHYETL